MDEAIEKFMGMMGINYDIYRTSKVFHDNRTGRRVTCFTVNAYHGGEKQYEQHHCYAEKRDGGVLYEEGNDVKSPGKGVFSYLGMDKDVNRYFEKKARQMAIDFFSKN